MIDIPAKEIVLKIKEEKGVSEDEINAKIQEKLKQLAGLVSEDGAAHIVANEMGVELGGVVAREAKIKDLAPGMRSVTVAGKVTRLFELREFNTNGRQGKVASFLLADETGQIRVTLWNEQADLLSKLNEGDVARVNNAYVKENRGYTDVHLNNDSALDINPSGVRVQAQTRKERERKQVKELAGNEENVEILGTIVQVYDPRFFTVDPNTGKRVQDGHTGEVAYNYVLNAFLDDGTGTIRTTFWKEQILRLLNKSDEQMLAFKDNPNTFEDVKNDLLGEIIKVVGRCKKNEMFDRIELTANLVFTDVDPAEELARMEKESNEGSKETSDTDEAAIGETEKNLSEKTATSTESGKPKVVMDESPSSEKSPEPPAEETPAEKTQPEPTQETVSNESVEASKDSNKEPVKAAETADSEKKKPDAMEEDIISLDDLEDLEDI